jgi:hypothetical protein
VDDGLHHDERQHSATLFPFLAPTDQASGAQNEQDKAIYK